MVFILLQSSVQTFQQILQIVIIVAILQFYEAFNVNWTKIIRAGISER